MIPGKEIDKVFHEAGGLCVFGPDAKTHDAICGVSGSFEKTVAQLKRSTEKKSLTVVFPVLDENHTLLAATIKTFSSKTVKHFHLLYPKHDLVKKTVPQLKSIVEEIKDKVVTKQKSSALRLTAQDDISVPLGIALGWPLSDPKRAVIEIANDCNLKCDFCWTHSPEADWQPTRRFLDRLLDKKVFFKYVDELAKFKVTLVELCASGDPLFHPDVWEMIEYISAKGLAARISTNGTMITAKRADRLVELGVGELFMNISAGDRDAYAAIHNCSPTIFDNLARNLKHLSDMREREGRKHPYMRFINVITEKNIGNTPSMIDFAIETRANYVDFREVWVVGEFLRQFELTKKDTAAMLERRKELVAKLDRAGIDNNLESFFDGLMRFFAKAKTTASPAPKESAHAPPCSMSYSFTLLDVRSNLRFCCHGEKMTQRYQENAEEAWTDVRYQIFRDHWRERYRANKGLCEACPHVEENTQVGEALTRLGLSELV